MGHLPSRGVRIRRERVARIAWSLLAAFIVAGSAGTWSQSRPGIWAPTLIVLRDVLQNVALYVPFGILGMWSLARSDRRGVVRVTAIAILFSIAVEALQLYTVDRVASLTDIGSAGVGTAAGASLVAWFLAPR